MTIRGFVDTHNHQFANLGFGGREFFGSPRGPVDQSLPWCDGVHGPGGVLDPVGTVVKWFSNGYPSAGHKVGGYPQFDGWPRYDSVTHQAVHRDWLERAWRGGLRVLVVLAVNNEWMTSLPGFQLAPGRTGDDMEAIRFQLDAAHALQAEIDHDHGGPGQGWYRIVTDPDQARAVAEAGQLAVVLGVEVDYLLGSHPAGTPLTEAAMRAGVADLAERGVRYVFPIHFGDNQFGGAAIQNNLEVSVPGPLVTPLGLLPAPYVMAEEPAPVYEFRGQRNPRGLTPLGKALVRELISLGMLIDVDHMSFRSRSDTLDIAESYGYPVLAGHSGYASISRGAKSHEGQLLGVEIDRIIATRGMICPIIAQGTRDEIATVPRPDGTSVPHVCGRSDNTLLQAYLYAYYVTGGKRVGIGTDFNGFAGLPGPTAGPEADYAHPPAGTVVKLQYPFTAVSGVVLDRSQIGQKTFDINTDGVAHVGMLPDLVAHLRAQGATDDELAPLLRSAEDFVTLWTDAAYATSAAATVGKTGQAYVFWRGSDGQLWEAMGDARQPLHGPMALGMGPLGSAPSVGVDAAGATYAYWRGTDRNLWSAHWDGAKWVGPVNNGMGPLDSTPAVAISANAQAYVFWRGTDGQLWQALGDARQPLHLAQKIGMGPLGSAPSVGVDAAGATYAYWRGTDNNLWSAHWDGAKWVGPVNNGMGPLGSAPALAVMPDAQAYVFWRGTDGQLWEAMGDARQPLHGPMALGMGPLGSAPSVGVDAAGATYAYWRGTDRNLWAAHWDGAKWVGPVNNGMGPLA